MQSPSVHHEDALWLLAELAARAGRPFHRRVVERELVPPVTVAEVRRVAGALGLDIVLLAASLDDHFRSGRFVCWRAFDVTACARDEEPEASTDVSPNGVAVPNHVRPILVDGANGRTVISRDGDVPASPFDSSGNLVELWEVREGRNSVHVEDGAIDGVTPSVASDAGATGSRARFGFRSLWPELLKYRSIWRDVLLASLAIQVVGLGTPLLTQVVIDKVLVHQTRSTLLVVAIGLAVFLALSSALAWIRQYLVAHTGNRVDAVLGLRVFAHLLKLPPRYFDRRPTGTIMARLQGIETIRDFITGAAITLILDLPFLLIFLAVMFAYSWQLSLLALGITFLIAAASAIATPLLRRRIDEQFLRSARVQAFATEYVAGFSTVKSLQLEPVLERRYQDLMTEYLRTTFATRQLANTFNTVTTTLEQAMSLGILVAGALIVMRNDGFTIGMLVAFQMFAGRMAQPLMRLVGLWQEFQQASIAVRRLGDLMDAPAEPYALTPTRLPRTGAAVIECESVGFRYGDDQPWLFRDLSLSLPAGKVTVLTGGSGSGKSTFAKLLLGFHRVQEGCIRLDGHDIATLHANELRTTYGVVPQETVLFSGTLLENLRLAKANASFEEIAQACRMAEIHDAIERMPAGYETPIGEQGVGLSGGQRQRVAIARALLRQPRMLVFDEATSNLDPSTAEALARTINRLRGHATILFIAHHVPRGLTVDQIARLGAPRSSAAAIPSQGAGE